MNTRLYPVSHSGDIQVISAGSSHAHINLQHKNVDGGKGQLVNKHARHQTEKKKKYTIIRD